jgi:hypothetical protein
VHLEIFLLAEIYHATLLLAGLGWLGLRRGRRSRVVAGDATANAAIPSWAMKTSQRASSLALRLSVSLHESVFLAFLLSGFGWLGLR